MRSLDECMEEQVSPVLFVESSSKFILGVGTEGDGVRIVNGISIFDLKPSKQGSRQAGNQTSPGKSKKQKHEHEHNQRILVFSFLLLSPSESRSFVPMSSIQVSRLMKDEAGRLQFVTRDRSLTSRLTRAGMPP